MKDYIEYLLEDYRDKDIFVNIWDDYKQEPEYDKTDNTYLYVEDHDIPNIMVNYIVKELFNYIKDNIKLDNVTFKIISKKYGMKDAYQEHHNEKAVYVKRDRIEISGLTTEKREELLEKIKKSNIVIADVPLKFGSES